ncbi:uncharacterized protein LOC106672292 [Cimex lectularius]|uniref:Uncharacterized protein n=1 Tax=Cimex lectularius TaxID=79782 RepID=A0A8I6S9K6_CIMLE|nr:uncharacterized protein LOC106672292 [Cimex lectularius]
MMLMQRTHILYKNAKQIAIGRFNPNGRVVSKKTPHLQMQMELSTEKSSTKLSDIACQGRYAKRKIGVYFSIWYWLVKFGMKRCTVIKIRRKLKRYSYPWLFFAFPAGIYMFLGDTIAQLCMEKESSGKYNISRGLHYAAIGVLITGPFSSKWSLFWLRRIPRNRPTSFMAISLLLDIFLLMPTVALITMACIDYKVIKEKLRHDPKNIAQIYDERYKECMRDIMKFYVQTRPLLGIVSCFILPKSAAKLVRTLYYICFYSVMSNAIFRAGIGHYQPVRVSETKGKFQEGCECIKDLISKFLPTTKIE